MNLMNNSVIKKSIARKLAVRVSVVLISAFMLLLVGAFLSLKRTVKLEAEHYAKVVVGIYGDLIVYESGNVGRPVDVDFADRINFFGEYLCKWYRVDYLYTYVPDVENGTLKYLSVIRDEDKFGDLSLEHMTGVTMPYRLTDSEMAAWNSTAVFSVGKRDRFGKAMEVSESVIDDFGNRVMVGASISSDELFSEMMLGFHIIILFMFIIVTLVAGLLYLLIRRKVTAPARSISQKMAEYISGGKRSAIKLDVEEGDEFSMMADSFNHMTEDMDKYIDDIARLGREKERQQAEVDIAAGIQKGILPNNFAYLENCAIKAVMKPAKLIGGDLYDYLVIDRMHTMLVVADVSGKGISSAMLMAIALTSIRQFAKMGYSPADILKNANDQFAEENPKLMFVTAFVCIYDSEKGVLTYANAGHNPPYIIKDKPELLDGSQGIPLGLFPGEEYENVEIAVEQEDSLFLYTDGVNEAVNSSGEFYGTDRLEKVLRETAALEKKHYIEAVEASVSEFTGEAEQSDDITMLSCYFKKREPLELDYDISEFSRIREYLFASSIPKSMLMDLCVAAEECFVNICSYAFDGPAPEGEKILFDLEYSNKVTMMFSDSGKKFDPRCDLPNTEEYDIDTAVGGLGRLIAFTVADSVDYEYRDGRNVLTITKTIKK